MLVAATGLAIKEVNRKLKLLLKRIADFIICCLHDRVISSRSTSCTTVNPNYTLLILLLQISVNQTYFYTQSNSKTHNNQSVNQTYFYTQSNSKTNNNQSVNQTYFYTQSNSKTNNQSINQTYFYTQSNSKTNNNQ